LKVLLAADDADVVGGGVVLADRNRRGVDADGVLVLPLMVVPPLMAPMLFLAVLPSPTATAVVLMPTALMLVLPLMSVFWAPPEDWAKAIDEAASREATISSLRMVDLL
jgi:hypothetical protein